MLLGFIICGFMSLRHSILVFSEIVYNHLFYSLMLYRREEEENKE